MKRYVLICKNCGAIQKQDLYACSVCGGALYTRYDLSDKRRLSAAIRNANEFWDYAPLFPIEQPHKAVTMKEGFTPLLNAGGLGEELDISRLYIKNEAVNPTGTFKDRCMSISVSKALENGDKALIIGSAGNAGAAAAAYAALAKLPCYVFVPASTPKERIAQISVCGAKVIGVEGGVTDCIRLIKEAAPKRALRNITTAAVYNPFQADAEKAIAYEMAKAMDWNVPDWIIVPVGGGGILAGIYQGYKDLLELGIIDHLPKMAGVQEIGCAPLVDAFEKSSPSAEIEEARSPAGIAVAIMDSFPLDGASALDAIYESGGQALAVSGGELMAGQLLLARTQGVYAEPASATAIAALRRLREAGTIARQDSVACVITGSGMKQMNLTAEYLAEIPCIKADAGAAEELFDALQ